MKRYTFEQQGGHAVRREFNGAGDLVHEAIVLLDRMTVGMIDRLAGGRVRGPCAGCERRREDWNGRLPFPSPRKETGQS